MKKVLALLLVLLLASPLIVRHYIEVNKPVYVTADRFLKECGYEMPKNGDKIFVKSIDTELLKLDMGVTKVVYTGYEKVQGGDIYMKVVSPIYLRNSPYLEVGCRNTEAYAE